MPPRTDENTMGPCEKMCMFGLPLPEYEGVLSPANSVLQELVLSEHEVFVPLRHLTPAAYSLGIMRRLLLGYCPVPRAYLLTGPKGSGKSHMLRTFAQEMASQSAANPDGKLTLCCMIDLSKHDPSDTRGFDEWLLGSVAQQLRGLGRHAPVAKALEYLAETAKDTPTYMVHRIHLRHLWPSDDGAGAGDPEALTPELYAALMEAYTSDRKDIVNVLLKAAGIAVIALVDEVECLFKASHFTEECASKWNCEQLCLQKGSRPALGLLMCSSFLPVEHMFYSKRQLYQFPPEYTHSIAQMKSCPEKLKCIRLGGPSWSIGSLKKYILAHACRRVDPSFNVYKQGHGRLPTLAALVMAKKLDALLLWEWGAMRAYSSDCQRAACEYILEQCGHSCRSLALYATDLMCSWDHSSPWPEHDNPEVPDAPCEPTGQLEQVLDAFLELLSPEDRQKLREVSMSDFRPENFTVPKHELKELLEVRTGKRDPVPEEYRNRGYYASAPTPVTHSSLIAPAISAGWFEDSVCDVALRCLGVYRRHMTKSVHRNVLAWLRHPMFAKLARLPIARALGRTPEFNALVLVQSGEGVGPSNCDSRAGQLAEVPLRGSEPTPGVPIRPEGTQGETHGPPGVGAGAPGGSGETSGPEDTWSGRAWAARTSLQKSHPSLRQFLALEGGAFLAAEPSDIWGGDLVGVLPSEKDGVWTARIVRLNVKCARQGNLRGGGQASVAHYTSTEQLEALCGVRHFKDVTKEALHARHMQAVRAMGDLIVAARMAKSQPLLESQDMEVWQARFAAFSQSNAVIIEDGGPCILMQCEAPDDLRLQLQEVGVHIVDSMKLKGHWGELQDVCDEVGLFLGSSTDGEPMSLFDKHMADFWHQQREKVLAPGSNAE